MRNKIYFILTMLCLTLGIHAESQTKADSLKAIAINKEAENPNFVHAYLLDITPGRAFYSVYGHTAIRLICPSKRLDYCFSFEMDMKKSSYIDVFTRQAKAGYFMLPTPLFINKYKEEGRGVTAYELNLAPKEKQNLWRFLDSQINGGGNLDIQLHIDKLPQHGSICHQYCHSALTGRIQETTICCLW